MGIRTHCWSQEVETLYQALSRYFSPHEIFILVDAVHTMPNMPDNLQVIYWGKDFIHQNKLIDYPYRKGVAWLCGDYFYYAFKQAVKADFYWLIEPDIGFTFLQLSDFFDYFERDNSDAWLLEYGSSSPEWYWHQYGKLLAPEAQIRKCFFPLSRLSANAINCCLTKRQQLSMLCHAHKLAVQHYPNDEVFVATVLCAAGLQIRSFNVAMPDVFKHFTWGVYFSPINGRYPTFENKLLHSSLSQESLSTMLADYLAKMLEHDPILQKYYIDPLDIEALTQQVKEQLKVRLEKNFKEKSLS